MRKSLIDAGPLIALFDSSDQHHKKVLNFMESYSGRLLTTWPVLTEVCYMLDFNKQTQIDFLDWIIEGGVVIENLHQWQLQNIRETFVTYSDLPADLADATLLELANSENISSIITLDKDFTIYRNQDGEPLTNLLAD